jgi:DNA-binding HTH domain-containing proteins
LQSIYRSLGGIGAWPGLAHGVVGMRFTGAFQDCSADLVEQWRSQVAEGVSDRDAFFAAVRGRLRANMIMAVTDTSADDPLEFQVSFVHRFSLPSGIIRGVDPQEDQRFSQFGDQDYLRTCVIPAYLSVIEMRRPVIDQVKGKLFGFRILYDRIILPEPGSRGRVGWCLSLTETRFALPIPDCDPCLDYEDIKVLQLLREGESAKEIGERCGFSKRTIEGRIERLRRRFGARNVAHLIALSLSHACESRQASDGSATV